MKQPPSGIENLYASVIRVRNEYPASLVHIEINFSPELTGRRPLIAELEGKGHEGIGGGSEGECQKKKKEQREKERVKRKM
ncbi:MAG: hypothetical protein J7M27_07320 [Candidatus Latescibacteria bacterium]|nr:hypothetical protein [Candidatus Latescibacterota bacterium]